MSKVTLHLDFEYDFYLIGIVCNLKDYRLSYSINKYVGIDLKKQDNLEIIVNKQKETSVYSVYMDQGNDGETYRLLANKGSNGFLIPEQRQMDYFLQVRTFNDSPALEDIRKILKNIALIQGAYEIKVEELKSRENLLF